MGQGGGGYPLAQPIAPNSASSLCPRGLKGLAPKYVACLHSGRDEPRDPLSGPPTRAHTPLPPECQSESPVTVRGCVLALALKRVCNVGGREPGPFSSLLSYLGSALILAKVSVLKAEPKSRKVTTLPGASRTVTVRYGECHVRPPPKSLG